MMSMVLFMISSVTAQSAKITFATNLDWPELEEAVRVFESAYPDIEVELMAIGQNVEEDLLTLYAAGLAPDAFTIYHSVLPGFIANNLIARLDSFFERDASVNVRDYVGLDMGPEGIWALPLTVNAWFTIYNQDLFSQMGVEFPQEGWTPDDLMEKIRKLTQDKDGDGLPDQWGYAGYNSMRDLNAAESWFRPFGGNLFDRDGTPIANSTAMKEALNFWRTVVASGNNLVANFNANDQWISGRVGLSVADRVYLATQAQILKFDFALAPLPFKKGVKPDSVGSGHYFAINALSKYPDAAWRWITWITGPQAHRIFLERGLLPGHVGAFEIYQEYWDSKANQFNIPKNVHVITDTTAYITPPTVVYSGLSLAQLNPIFREYLDAAVINGTMAPEPALDEMQRQFLALKVQ